LNINTENISSFKINFLNLEIKDTLKKYNIIEGVSINDFILHETTFKDVINKLGNPDSMYIKIDTINCMDFFRPKVARYEAPSSVYQYVYEYKKEGLRFIFEDYNDKLHIFNEKFNELKVEFISVFSKFQGINKKGIQLKNSTLKDVIKKYGKNKYKLIFGAYSIYYPYKNIAFKFEKYRDLQWFHTKFDKDIKVTEIMIFNYDKASAK
jgi:hypothetical protein